MYINNFTPGQSTWILQRKAQFIQLFSQVKSGNMAYFLNSEIKIWNNTGTLMPITRIADLIVMNGDEYNVQVGYDGSNFNVVVTIELCDSGSLNPPINVMCNNMMSTEIIELSALDVKGTTCVRTRLYNTMNIVAPVELPKHSVCIFSMSNVKQLQMNNDVMANAEIFTHSYKVLISGALGTTHPVLIFGGVPVDNEFYTVLVSSYVCGYASPSTGDVIISTGDDTFVLYPNITCPLTYCQKEYTEIAEQVNSSLLNEGQRNNVDSEEFAAAVAAVGEAASRNNLKPSQTQYIANKVVNMLPSVVISRMSGVKNFNLASENSKSGFSQIVKS